MPTGTVKWYNEQKGYGFIEQEDGRDLFVHYTAVRGKLNQGDKVEYELGEGQKGPCATKVRVAAGTVANNEGAAGESQAVTSETSGAEKPEPEASV